MWARLQYVQPFVTNHWVCYIYPNFRLLPFFNVWPRTVDLPVWMCSNTQRKTDACCYFTDCIIVENLLHVFCNERHLVPYPRILLYVHISCKLTQHFPFLLKHRWPELTSQEKANDEFMNASRVVWPQC